MTTDLLATVTQLNVTWNWKKTTFHAEHILM